MVHLIILSLIAHVYSLCSMTQHCPNPPYDCDVPIKVDPPIPPWHANFTPPYACPMFLGQTVCCNNDQNSNMNYKYFLLDETFGHSIGGCDICAANMKYLWCHFSCNQLQSQFVSTGEQKYVPNPVEPSQMQLVLLMNFTVTNSLACQIYESCQKCPYVTQVSAMQSPQGFLQFQGYESIPIGFVWTTFIFDDSPQALDLEFLPCQTNVTTAYGYEIVPCSCNSCLSQCQASYYAADPSTLEGIDWPLVGIVYLVIFVISTVVLFGKFTWDKHKKKKLKNDAHLDPAEILLIHNGK
ncbi:unnamed protein product [Blepharisma stoltei]|uniref:Niemann-Pick C1 N-terminal domain-containing protein n=1 Tax=Blepharisma stoltei TaxID=1481888 RepID=A0AAU9I8M0_9CILI|nr:unnamed protein product [Blepharisma stoltei]